MNERLAFQPLDTSDASPHDRARASTEAAELAMLLTTGGDERIAVDLATGRNRYGVTPWPAPNEIFFASSTASSPTQRGFDAALHDWRALKESADLAGWFERLRMRIRSAYGTPDCEVVLAPSGTETEYVALALASSAAPGPLTNVVVAPAETGRGVLLAAAGAHFLPSAPFRGAATPGARLSGFENVAVEHIEIREADGNLRPAHCVEADAFAAAIAALSQGRSVLAHLLLVSKTGRSGLNLEALKGIQALAPERVVVVADCCQLRSTPKKTRALLNLGFLVAITGSKFAGGPPFCGALLIPSTFCRSLRTTSVPPGLAAHSSFMDWPSALRAELQLNAGSDANLGLGLRWSAALTEIERFLAVPLGVAMHAKALFRQDVLRHCEPNDALVPIAPPCSGEDFSDTIIPVQMRNGVGSYFNESGLLHVKRALLEPLSGAPASLKGAMHVGQSVMIGDRPALRVCLGAPMIADYADRVTSGEAFDAAFRPIAAHLRMLFDKWQRVIAQSQGDAA